MIYLHSQVGAGTKWHCILFLADVNLNIFLKVFLSLQFSFTNEPQNGLSPTCQYEINFILGAFILSSTHWAVDGQI